ncbi:hypothetical protein EW093_01265 [Thiospirochaeta perfilievii]|uniref:TolC family protein n=1 Tax=Thiospirochaeta perfilievii TaxID=252967 RepID=A0A5C1Q7M6_9SPIO|nr:TolC family protein [Thiospirochaeta perfilievii]QEN03387.1 hypothetical protein EW093_01265 [Thiospirochaeta perfilievii]
MKKLLYILIFFSLLEINALDFETVLKNVNNTFEIKNSVLEITKLEKELIEIKNPDDLIINLTPSIKLINPEDSTFIDDAEITGTISTNISTGLTKLEKEKVLFANNNLRLSKMKLEEIKFTTYIKVFELYKKLWLLQAEEKVIRLELEAALEYEELLTNSFESGTSTLFNLYSSVERKENTEISLNQNILEQRVSMYELMFTIGQNMKPEQLENINIKVTELPDSKTLYNWLLENSNLIKIEKIKLSELIETTNRLDDFDVDMSIRPFYSSPGNAYSASANYNFTSKELTPTLSFNISNNSDTWSTGISMNLSVGSNKSDNLESDSLEVEYDIAQAKLNLLIETLNLNLKKTYQKYIQNRELLYQAEGNYKNAKLGNDLVKTKIELGQLSKYELLESNANLLRSQWKVESARVNYQLSWLSVLESSSWYSKTVIEYELND